MIPDVRILGDEVKTQRSTGREGVFAHAEQADHAKGHRSQRLEVGEHDRSRQYALPGLRIIQVYRQLGSHRLKIR